MKLKIIGGASLFLLLSLCIFIFIFTHQKPGYASLPVKTGTIKKTVISVGQIEPEEITQVRSPLSGNVQSLYVHEGDHVKKGQPLLTVTPLPTPEDLARAVANLNSARAQFDKQNASFLRHQKLYRKRVISAQAFDNARADYEGAKANFELASEQLQLIKTGTANIGGVLTNNQVLSPAEGYVLKIYVSKGDSIVPVTAYQPGTILFVIADMDRLIYRGSVSQSDVGHLKLSMPATIELHAKPEMKTQGNLARIGLSDINLNDSLLAAQEAKLFDAPAAFSHGYPVEVGLRDIENFRYLRAGMQATASFLVENREGVLLAPIRLLQYDSVDSPYIWILKKGKPFKQRVELGLSDASDVEIKSGLQADSLLLLDPEFSHD